MHEILEAMEDVAESDPNFFRKEFENLFHLCILISKESMFDNEKLRLMPLELFNFNFLTHAQINI